MPRYFCSVTLAPTGIGINAYDSEQYACTTESVTFLNVNFCDNRPDRAKSLL